MDVRCETGNEDAVSILDALGIKVDNIETDELIASALLLVRVITEDGKEYVAHYSSDGMSTIEKIGMLRVAERVTIAQFDDFPEDDD